MKRQKNSLTILILGFIVAGCTGTFPNVSLKNPESGYSDKALTTGYLKRKLNYFINNNGAKLVKELNYERFKDPSAIQEITFNDQTTLQSILDNPDVQKRITVDQVFAAYINSLIPVPPVPLDSLAAYFPFNGNASDESNNGNDGIVHNVTLTTDRFGNSNSAYSFNGSDSWIEIPPGNTLDVGTGDYSIAAWIKTTASNYGRIFSKGSSGCVTGYMMRMGGDGSRVHIENANGGCIVWGYGNTPVNDGNWHFITGVVKRDTGAKIYIDGNLDFEEQIDTTGINLSNGNHAMIGYNDVGNAYEPFNGVIDDVRIYKKALAFQEIQSLLNQ